MLKKIDNYEDLHEERRKLLRLLEKVHVLEIGIKSLGSLSKIVEGWKLHPLLTSKISFLP